MLFHHTPYARFIQLARVAAQEHAREQKNELRQATLIGYQFYLCQPLAKGSQHKSFAEWAKAFGVSGDDTPPVLQPGQVEHIRQQAEANERKVVDMFKRRPKIS